MENTQNKNYYYIGEFMKLKNQIFESLYSSDDDEPLYKNVPIKYVIENKIEICDKLIREQKIKQKRAAAKERKDTYKKINELNNFLDFVLKNNFI